MLFTTYAFVQLCRPSDWIQNIYQFFQGKVAMKKRKKCTVAPVAEVSSNASSKPNFGKDFVTASALFKKKFLQDIA